MSTEIGKVIQANREINGITQEELANRLGVSQQSVAKWEAGKTSPRPKMYPLIADELNIERKLLDVANWRDRWGSVEQFPPSISAVTIPPGNVESSNRPDQSFAPRKGSIGYPKVFTEQMEELLQSAEIHGEWNVTVRGASTRWSVDFMTDEYVVNFAHAVEHSELASLTKAWLRITLWNMVTMRAASSDKRHYSLIITVPRELDVDVEFPLNSGTTPSAALQRLTAEAAIMDISVFLVRTPSQVISLLKMDHEDSR